MCIKICLSLSESCQLCMTRLQRYKKKLFFGQEVDICGHGVIERPKIFTTDRSREDFFQSEWQGYTGKRVNYYFLSSKLNISVNIIHVKCVKSVAIYNKYVNNITNPEGEREFIVH